MTDKTNHSLPKSGGTFRVPDGYFDSLADRVMSRIPAQEVRMVETKAPARRLGWQRYAAAAAVVAAIFGAGLYFGHQPAADTQLKAPVSTVASTSTTPVYDAEFDNVTDYIMCDDYDLYAYLANE